MNKSAASTLKVSRVDQDTIAILATARQENPRGHQAILGEVARVAHRRIAPPENDQVTPVLDLAQGTGDLTDFLECDSPGSAARAGRGINTTADPVTDRDSHPLSFRGDVGKAANDRIFRLGQDPSRAFNPTLDWCGLPFDQTSRNLFEAMAEEPRLTRIAGVFRLDDASIFDRERNIIAKTAAMRASGVFDGPRNGRVCR